MMNLYLYVIVFISGAAVLAVEILGTRILGPFYGVSLFLWSALITVTLAALSAGYAIGGRWADKGAKMSRLSTLVAGAGIWLLLIPWIKHPLLSLTEQMGLRFAVLAAAFILFFPPLILLGMISPYAIKLKTASLDEVGRTAGNLYAISTVASVLSALLTGFFLIPNFGVNRLTVVTGVVLLITAAIGLATDKKKLFGALVLVIVGTASIRNLREDSANPEQGLVAVEQSAYAELRVLDTENGRHLLMDGGIQTLVDTASWKSNFPYVAVMDLARYFFDQPGQALLIGLGGGSLVKNCYTEGWTVEAVEIDPQVIAMAHKYFGLNDSEVKIYNMDGRQFLNTSQKRYDIILLDAFGSSSIPFHLITQESFGLMASHLQPQGVLAINVEVVGWDDILVRSVAATLKPHFSEVLALPIAEPPNKIGNLILLASNHKLELRRELERDYFDPEYRFGPKYQRVHAWDNNFVPDTRNVPVLTDDLNPVDIWAERIKYVARQDLHRYFAPTPLSW
jgi:spermidine synthase